MSKASEWAEKAQELTALEEELHGRWADKPRFRVDGGGGYVPGEVSSRGHLVTARATLTPYQALQFARWILETFDEAP